MARQFYDNIFPPEYSGVLLFLWLLPIPFFNTVLRNSMTGSSFGPEHNFCFCYSHGSYRVT